MYYIHVQASGICCWQTNVYFWSMFHILSQFLSLHRIENGISSIFGRGLQDLCFHELNKTYKKYSRNDKTVNALFSPVSPMFRIFSLTLNNIQIKWLIMLCFIVRTIAYRNASGKVNWNKDFCWKLMHTIISFTSHAKWKVYFCNCNT